jgi:hypothetical protein
MLSWQHNTILLRTHPPFSRITGTGTTITLTGYSSTIRETKSIIYPVILQTHFYPTDNNDFARKTATDKGCGGLPVVNVSSDWAI